MTSWLTLQDYSIKKGLSVSTLRRKIKNKEIKYRLENGRYLLKAETEVETAKSYEENPYKKELERLHNDKEDLLNLINFLESEKRAIERQFINLKRDHDDLLVSLSFLKEERSEFLKSKEKQTTLSV